MAVNYHQKLEMCLNLNILLSVNSKDRLAVVTYDTNVYVDFHLKLMNQDNKADSRSKVCIFRLRPDICYFQRAFISIFVCHCL